MKLNIGEAPFTTQCGKPVLVVDGEVLEPAEIQEIPAAIRVYTIDEGPERNVRVLESSPKERKLLKEGGYDALLLTADIADLKARLTVKERHATATTIRIPRIKAELNKLLRRTDTEEPLADLQRELDDLRQQSGQV